MYLQLYIVVSVSCQPFISSFCAVILLICGVDIRRQAAWLAWHDPHLCWEVHVLVSNVNIWSNQHMANSFCARTKSKSKLLKMFCYQNDHDLMELWVHRDRAASFPVGGLKKNAWRKIWVGGDMLVDFYSISLKWRRMRITIKLLIFFHIFSDLAIGSEISPSLNWNTINCYVILLISTFNYYK